MNRGNLVACLQLNQITIAHAVIVEPATCTENAIFFVGVNVGNLQFVFDAVKFDGD